jgi:hypothetical protein
MGIIRIYQPQAPSAIKTDTARLGRTDKPAAIATTAMQDANAVSAHDNAGKSGV